MEKHTKKLTLLIMAGGTGGHVYPALAVAEAWCAAGHAVVWMGTRSGIEARVVPAAGIPMEWLAVTGIRGKGVWGLMKSPFMLLRALWQSSVILRKVRPDVVLGMGGFVAGPGGLMARFWGIPLVLHEQNRIPGTTNRLLSGLAQRVLEAFPGSFAPKVGAICTGNPLRANLCAPKKERQREDEDVHLLIMGGSLGAMALNEQVPQALSRLGCSIKVLHQSGTQMLEQTRNTYTSLGIPATVQAFVDDMAAVYAWADLVVCRSGAMTISELAAAGLPALLIPFPYAIDDHQTANARYFSDAGAAILLDQKDLSPERLAKIVENLILNRHRLNRMGIEALTLARPQATQDVVHHCLQAAQS
ncbi:MAG: undecaprenyldiphospho-muramoylpentapeptide beta-N-acetylglucosaminyltransferase [Methylococcaceae bacterium]